MTMPFPLYDLSVDAAEPEGVTLVFLLKKVWDPAPQQAAIARQPMLDTLPPDAHAMREQAHA